MSKESIEENTYFSHTCKHIYFVSFFSHLIHHSYPGFMSFAYCPLHHFKDYRLFYFTACAKIHLATPLLLKAKA